MYNYHLVDSGIDYVVIGDGLIGDGTGEETLYRINGVSDDELVEICLMTSNDLRWFVHNNDAEIIN